MPGRTSARHATEQTKAIGFDLIEIPILEPESFDVAMTKRLLEDSGLPAACSLGLSPDTDVSSEDPQWLPAAVTGWPPPST